MECDHKDRNKKNYQRDNLIVSSHTDNKINTGLQPNNTSGIRGVSQTGSRWMAHINDKPDHQKNLGIFDTIQEAIKARKDAEIQYWGKLCKY